MKRLKNIDIEIDWFWVFLVIAVIIYVPLACVYHTRVRDKQSAL